MSDKVGNVPLCFYAREGGANNVRGSEGRTMKWIIVAGPSDTGKTYALSEVVIELIRRGWTLMPPAVLPILISATATTPAKYPDGVYELTLASRKIVVYTYGDYPSDIGNGFDVAKKSGADILISASRSKTGSGHLAAINARITPSIEPFFVAALDHDVALHAKIRANRVDQIVEMI